MPSLFSGTWSLNFISQNVSAESAETCRLVSAPGGQASSLHWLSGSSFRQTPGGNHLQMPVCKQMYMGRTAALYAIRTAVRKRKWMCSAFLCVI